MKVAEGVGFEPTLRFPVNTLSKRAPSATRPPLHASLAHGDRHIFLQANNPVLERIQWPNFSAVNLHNYV